MAAKSARCADSRTLWRLIFCVIGIVRMAGIDPWMNADVLSILLA